MLKVRFLLSMILMGAVLSATAAQIYVLPIVKTGFPITMTGDCAANYASSAAGAKPCVFSRPTAHLTFTDANKKSCNVIILNKAGSFSVDPASTCGKSQVIAATAGGQKQSGAPSALTPFFPGAGTTLLIPAISSGAGGLSYYVNVTALSPTASAPVVLTGCSNQSPLSITAPSAPQCVIPASGIQVSQNALQCALLGAAQTCAVTQSGTTLIVTGFGSGGGGQLIAPTNLAWTGGRTQGTLSWTAASDPANTGAQFTYTVNGLPATPVINGVSATVTGLTAGTTYSAVTVAAAEVSSPLTATSQPFSFTTNGPHGEQIFKGLGVNYAPGHYPNGDLRNDEDESNVYAELQQLQAAGFSTVRMYGEPAKTWIATINAANALGMDVVYQLALCQSDASGNCLGGGGSFASVQAAELSKLNSVITTLPPGIFQKVVKLIIVGNEIFYNDAVGGTNASQLSGAIQAVTNLNLGMPITISLQADVWMGGGTLPVQCQQNPQSTVGYNCPVITAVKDGLQQIAAAIPAGSPIAMNVYPFQWMVPAASAFDLSNVHSIPYYLVQIEGFYPGKAVMIAETGWATKGEYKQCSPPPQQSTCNTAYGALADAEVFYPALYSYANSNNVPLLTFMAFDGPLKDVGNKKSMTSEDYYGVFTKMCDLKKGGNGNALLPVGAAYTGTPACNNNQAIFTVVGGSNHNQPPYSISVKRNGIQVASISVPTADRTQESVTPWPTVTLQVGDIVTLTSSQHTCSNSVVSVNTGTHSGGTWQTVNPPGCTETNWAAGQDVYLDANF